MEITTELFLGDSKKELKKLPNNRKLQKENYLDVFLLSKLKSMQRLIGLLAACSAQNLFAKVFTELSASIPNAINHAA